MPWHAVKRSAVSLVVLSVANMKLHLNSRSPREAASLERLPPTEWKEQ